MWLVNAIARHCVDEIHEYRYGEPITVVDVLAAKEAIVRARGTHVDSLMERLKEERVRRVVEPVILGNDAYLSDMLGRKDLHAGRDRRRQDDPRRWDVVSIL